MSDWYLAALQNADPRLSDGQAARNRTTERHHATSDSTAAAKWQQVALTDLQPPDTAAARSALLVAQRYSTPSLLNHAHRSWLWARADALLRGVQHDAELLFVAALLHDLGLERPFDNVDLPFEEAGGHLAWVFATAAGWSDKRATRASEVIVRQAAGFAWPVDLTGLHQAWSFLKLRIDDLIKIGQLYLDHGRWKGEQVVPAEWVTAATTRHVDAHDGPMTGYGFQWWVEEQNGTPAYVAWGFGGQMLQVVPAHRLIIAVATELRFGDPTSKGVDEGPLMSLVMYAVINAFTDP